MSTTIERLNIFSALIVCGFIWALCFLLFMNDERRILRASLIAVGLCAYAYGWIRMLLDIGS
jgi:hypothetical protein